MHTITGFYIDLVIGIVLGLPMCILAFRTPGGGLAGAPAQLRARRILRICGPIVLLGPLFRFMINQPGPPDWQRHSSDGIASIEFPAPPVPEMPRTATDSPDAQYSALSYDIPYKDISLLLLSRTLSPDESRISRTKHLADLRTKLLLQGFSIVNESPSMPGSATGLEMELKNSGGNIHMWVRIALLADKVYLAQAISTGSHSDDPIIPHFIASLRVKTGGE